MRPIVLRFVATAVPFALWIFYLFYLYLHLPNSPNGLPVLLSRPQLLVSALDVVAAMEDDDRTVPLSDLLGPGEGADAGGLAAGAGFMRVGVTARVATIKQVLYPASSSLTPGRICVVTNFEACEIPGKAGRPPTPPKPLPKKLSELGSCLLPLRTFDNGLTWEVVPLPPSPGYRDPGRRPNDYRIYPANDETLAQYRQIEK
jgi:hypothetical protein